jgi:glycosyltransferase involved in cell wall biosynthesis
LRVGVVTTSYPREAGDPAGAFVAGFARWLRERGCAVEVIAAGPGAACVDGIAVERVDGRDLFYRGGAPDALSGSPAAWARAARFQGELLALVARRGRRWDAAVSHWLAPSGIAVAAALGRSRPHLAIAHSSDVTLLHRSKGGRAAARFVARRADLVYAAPHLASLIAGAPGRVVAMGIDPVGGGDRARGRARFTRGRVTALCLGRLVPVKGVDLALRALARAPELDLVVAGDGPERAALERAAAPLGARVRFAGEVRGRDRLDLFAAADLLVVPSRVLEDGRSEGTPTVILEGKAAGLPVLATRVGGAAEVISDGEDGLLVSTEVEALGRSLERLAGDRALRERLGATARARAARHDWSQVGPELAGRLLAGRPRE